MNFIDRLFVPIYHPRKNGTVYCDQGEMKVEILHLDSSEQRRVGIDKEISLKYSKYPLIINRPAKGSVTIEHNCRVCDMPLRIKVQSRKSLMNLIIPLLILCIIPIAILLIAVLTNAFSGLTDSWVLPIICMITGFLFPFSVIGLIVLLNKEYKHKGINQYIDVPGQFSGPQRHQINRSPVDLD